MYTFSEIILIWLIGLFVLYSLAIKGLGGHIAPPPCFFHVDFSCPPVLMHLIKVIGNWQWRSAELHAPSLCCGYSFCPLPGSIWPIK